MNNPGFAICGNGIVTQRQVTVRVRQIARVGTLEACAREGGPAGRLPSAQCNDVHSLDEPTSSGSKVSRATPAPKVSPKAPPPEVRPAPGAREARAIATARERLSARTPRVQIHLENDSNGKITAIGPEHSDHSGWLIRLQDTFGTSGQNFSLAQLNLIMSMARDANGSYDRTKINSMIAAVEGANPNNEVEAMLAVQMAVTHHLPTEAIQRAGRVDQIPQYDSAAGMAVKLMRTFAAQAETLAKLQRGGEQVVKVVHVHPGGQAVIGNVVGRPGGANGSPRVRGQRWEIKSTP
jgi:proteasome lid subunit RPN8/RPN11